MSDCDPVAMRLKPAHRHPVNTAVVCGLVGRPWGSLERRLSVLEIVVLGVNSGSAADLREHDLDAVHLPVELACHAADNRDRHVRQGAVVDQGRLSGVIDGACSHRGP